ncbi:MAG: hypothetical protein HYT36_00735, partial [Candidatus Staskawiczbacteria bacterium]|nr:hypothetical protein [Candidatus Staskawiczbacteria bacterium]
MKKYFNLLNIIFLVQVLTVVFVAIGLLPRFFILPLSALVAFYVLFDSVENSSVFFIRALPFFIAIPFTSYFDSFNLWRIASGLIFLKWLYQNKIINKIGLNLKEFIKKPAEYARARPVAAAVGLFFLMSALSLFSAEDLFSGIKRIIYIANLSLIGFVIYGVARNNKKKKKR